MPLFELAGGQRAEPVTTMRPDAASFAHVRVVVLEHLSTLLGERLFTTSGGESAADALGRGEAVVLAIDAAGDPVVVQAVPLLAADHLVVALRAAGRASGVPRRQLAASYASGPDHFHRDLAAFFERDGEPRATAAGRSARLVLVCAEIDDDAVDAVAYLSTDAARVQVLTVGTVAGPDGRRLLDVSSLRPGELTARQTVSLDIDIDADIDAETRTGVVTHAPADGDSDGESAAQSRPGPERTAALRRAPAPAAAPPAPAAAVSAAAALAQGALLSAFGRTAPAVPVATAVSAPDPAAVVDGVYVPHFLDLPESLVALPERPGDLPPLPDLAPVRAPRGMDLAQPASQLAALSAPQRPEPQRQRQPQALPRLHPRPPAVADPQPPPPAEPQPPLSADPQPAKPQPSHPRLTSLVRTLTAPVDLVWVRHRRGERFEVVLGLDGLLHGPDGAHFTDPDDAARSLSGAETSNGWRLWRAGESGPSLDELAPPS